ncbi:MAG: flagellar hook-length control protein FliK [Pseudomonadota bacterium]|nr:flagellar hook-length control protein FliK [Pseudomonadota bacterium]
MLTLPIITPALSDTIGVTPSQPIGNDGFLSLLSIVNDAPSPDNSQPAPQASQNNSQNSSQQQPQQQDSAPFASGAADNPAPPPAPQTANAPADSGNAQNAPPAKNAQDASSSPAANNPQSQPQPQPALPVPPVQQNTAATNTSAPVSATQSAGTITTGQADPASLAAMEQAAKKLLDGSQDPLAAIGQILTLMIQALQTGGPVANALPDASAQATSTTAGADPLSGQEMALLKDMQSLLQQIQQTLSGNPDAAQGTGQNTPDSQNVGNPLSALMDAFHADAMQLAQLWNQSSSDSGFAAQPGLPDLTTQLKGDIAQIRTQLDALKSAVLAAAPAASSNNNQPVVAANNNPVSALVTTSDNQAPLDTTVIKPAITRDVIADSATGVSSSSATSVAPDTSAQQPLPAGTPTLSTPVAAVAVQATLSGGASGDSGQGQGQSQGQGIPMPVAAAGVSTASDSGAATTVSFSRVLTQASPSPLLDQITMQVKTALVDGSSRIHIQLDPADLGKLDIRLDVSADGKTGITITADNKNTLALLQNDTQGLTKALNDAGLQADSSSLSFNLRGGQQDAQGQGRGNAQAAFTYQQAQPEEDDPVIPAITRSYSITLSDGLDITI